MADPAALAFLEKVELRGEGDLQTIRALLLESLAEADAGLELSEEKRGAAADWFTEHLRQMVVLADEEEQQAATRTAACDPASTLRTRAHLTPAAASLALHSPLLPPLSPPPADAEVVELEQRVDAQAQRVAELRASMLPQLQQMVQARLAAFRPTAELEPAEQRQQDSAAAGQGIADEAMQDADAAAVPAGSGATEQQGEGAQVQQGAQQPDSAGEQQALRPAVSDAQEAAAVPLSPQPAELQLRLSAAANRMPALRARLETATDRLQRVVSAVAADLNRPPPNTVEKAVLGKTPGPPAAGGKGEENVPGVSPLFKQALESGQISTRRRAARSPVPYSQPE